MLQANSLQKEHSLFETLQFFVTYLKSVCENGTIIHNMGKTRGGNAMAGLLETIAKQLLGSNTRKSTRKPVAPKTASSTTVKVRPVVTPTADEWVKNSTISESVETKSAITAIDRTIKRERIQTEVGKEDYLLTQIDEFREKAQQLQELLLSKETKVMELQHIVDEREGKARELENILNERQRKADGITAEVSKQIDTLIEKVSAKMDEIGVAIGDELKDGQKLNAQQAEELKETLASLNEQLETIKTDLSEKVHSENVKCYRNISDLFKSTEEKLDNLECVEQKVDSVRKCTIAIIVLTVINMLGLTALALYEMGVFQLLLG